MNRMATAGWSSLVARRAHNPKVVGSNPAPATRCSKRPLNRVAFLFSAFRLNYLIEKQKSVDTSLIPYTIGAAGWSSLVARRAHNPKVVGSNPAPATRCSKRPLNRVAFLFSAFRLNYLIEKQKSVDTSLIPYTIGAAGWSSLVARRAHNPKVVGSNPAPATTFETKALTVRCRGFCLWAMKNQPRHHTLGLSTNLSRCLR